MFGKKGRKRRNTEKENEKERRKGGIKKALEMDGSRRKKRERRN